MSSGIEVRRKPAQKRGQLRVQQILDASEALILEMGSEAVTTNHIAKRAGVNVGTLYHFFSNKSEIFLAILSRAVDQFEKAVAEADATPSADANEWIARLVDAQTEAWLANSASVRLYDALGSQPETISLIDEHDKRVIDLYCEGFKRYCPHIAPARRRHLGRAVLVMSYALIEDAIFAATPRDQQTRIREIYPALRSYICDSSQPPRT